MDQENHLTVDASNVGTEFSVPDGAQDDTEPTYDFSFPEDVLIVVDHCGVDASWGWRPNKLEIVETLVLDGPEDPQGAASYEETYGGFLDYVLEDICDPPEKPGIYVVRGVTAEFFKGDGYSTDDDMSFYAEGLRAATPEEARLIT